MKKMKKALAWLLLGCLVPTLCLGLTYQEDDLVFDDVGEETPTLSTEQEQQQPIQHSTSSPASSKKWQRVEKLLGMPDAVASVGHVFKLHVPKQAFAGYIDYYEARGSGGKGLPHWLRWDEPASALYGVPSRKDVGRHRVSIKAFGKNGDTAQDSFIIHVVPENHEHFKNKDGKKRCTEEQDLTMLTILIDARYENLKPGAKVNALENLAGFLGLHTSSISIQPEVAKESNSPFASSVVLSGPGNVHRRKEKHSTLVQWQVGCDGHFWPHQIDTIKQIPEQARDGTLSEVMQLPVYQWRVRSDPTDYARNRRDTAGSGFGELEPDGTPRGDDDDEEEYDEGDYDDEDDYDNNEGITESPQEPKQAKPVLHGGIVEEHPHRHHHGEDNIAGIVAGVNNEDDTFIWRNEDINNALFNQTSAATTTTTTQSTTIAVTIPSTTTTTTTTTTSTTTTSIPSTEPPTTPSSTTTESTTSSTTSTTTEQESPSPTTESTTSTSTTQTTSSSTIETLTTDSTATTTTTYTNLTQAVTSGTNSQSSNVTIDSLTVDSEEEPLTTERDEENEIEPDATTTLQSGAGFGVSESTTNSGGASMSPSGSGVEVLATAEPNVTSIFNVNATADEYTEASVPAREASPSSTIGSWNENATEKAPGEPLDPYDSINIPVYSSTPTSTSTTTESTTTSTPAPTIPSTTPSTTTTTTEPTTTTTSTTTTTTTTPEPATVPTTPSTTTSTTTTTTTTERIIFSPRNTPPRIEKRLKKLPITQGKLLSYTIPEDTFRDAEDGNTRQLRLRITENGTPLTDKHWLQFNEETQELYGLPVGDPYGPYTFEVEAMDREGLKVSDKLEIIVQQHKQSRAVNHQFHLYIKIQKPSAFPTNVDWQIKVMRSLAELYGDSDLSYITVVQVDNRDASGQTILSWTNDTLARTSICPQEEINKLYHVLVADTSSEEPSDALIRVLRPEMKPTRVIKEGYEQCQEKHRQKEYPFARNQIDQVNATAGQLFVYKVPQDTFFDESDGDTRALKVFLLTANRTEIPPTDWLQFDSKNQEFFGVPLKQDIGRKSYQLIAKDRDGLEGIDSLVAEVRPAPIARHVVEISMTLNMPYETFAYSAAKKREFIKKLQELYDYHNASAISLLSVSGNHDSTTVTWRNLSLPTDHCPHEDIERLNRVLVNHNKSFTEELNSKFNNNQQPEFAVLQITVSPMGACRKTDFGHDITPIDDSTSVGASHDDYLITFVLPAIIIAAMLILAGIIACILYKRRRSGKMSVSEKDDERQSFRSKGIPVIFQDELDEKPDPGNKSPIILKEEKPPLPPPEYQRAEDGADIPMLSKENSEEPYQPPPPFATNRDSNRQNRPKPTPTYRKPPPYVPP